MLPERWLLATGEERIPKSVTRTVTAIILVIHEAQYSREMMYLHQALLLMMIARFVIETCIHEVYSIFDKKLYFKVTMIEKS